MRKVNLITISLAFILVLFSLPMVLGAQNSVTDVFGNQSKLYFSLQTYQVTTNPTIGQNVTYRTEINVTGGDAKNNITWFILALPDNHSTQTASDFILTNSSGTYEVTGTTFTIGDYNTINFSGLNYTFQNQTGGWLNATEFNVSWNCSAPIAATKIGVSKSGRAYTETWNITSANSNLTIENASLVVTPTYWYTRIGAPTTVTFNDTTKDYLSSASDITVYTDLDIGTDGNMLEYGSGYETLSITYNGPIVSPSGGKSPTAPAAEITPPSFALWTLIVLGVLFVIIMMVCLVYLLRKKR